IKRGQDTQCDFDSGATSGQCSRIRGNVAKDEIIVLMGDGTSGRISQTYISDNTTTSNITTGLIQAYGPAGGAGTTLTLEGVTIFDNDTNFTLFESWGDLELRLEWSTVVDNVVRNANGLFRNHTVDGADPLITVNSSIIWQPGMYMTSHISSQDFFFDCNIAHSLAFSGQISRSLVADPKFVDAPGFNYHIQPDSPAVDFCDDAVSSPLDDDIDNQTRGVPASAGTNTPFDAG